MGPINRIFFKCLTLLLPAMVIIIIITLTNAGREDAILNYLLLLIAISLMAGVFFYQSLFRQLVKNKDGIIALTEMDLNFRYASAIQPKKIQDPGMRGTVTSPEDEEARKELHEKITRANSLYHCISRISQVILKATDREMLFKESCHLAVRVGKFRMAAIGLLDPQTNSFLTVAHAGEVSDPLSEINIVSTGGFPGSGSAIETAIRNGKYFCCNNIEESVEMDSWKEVALCHGYHSFISLPLKLSGRVTGVFTLYSAVVNFFEKETIELLEETADSISIALEQFEKEKLRKEAEEELLNSKLRYQKLAESSPVGVFHTDKSGFTNYVNPSWCRISGMVREDAMGNGWLNAVHADDKAALLKGWKEATKVHNSSTSEYRFVHPDGTIRWVIGQAIPELNAYNQVVGYVGTTTDITERKKAQEEIARLLRDKETVLNRINDGMVSVDNEWRYTFLNDKALAAHPSGKEETIGKVIWDVHPQVKNTVFWHKYHEAMKERKVVEFENYYPPMETWFSVKVYPSHDGLTIFYRDITESKKAEETIKANEKRVELIYNNTRDALFLISIVGQRFCFASVNQSFLTITGLGENEILDKFVDEIVPEPSLSRVVSNYNNAIAGKRTVQWEDISVYPSGTKTGIVTVTPLFDEQGNCTMLVGSVHDITERKKAAEEIVNNEKRFKALIENSTDGLTVIAPDGIVLEISPSGKKILGYDKEEIVGQFGPDLIHADDVSAVIGAFNDIINNPAGVKTIEYRHKMPDGSYKWLECSFNNLLQEPYLNAIVLNYRDITERKNATIQLKESEERYRKAQTIGRMGNWEMNLKDESLTWSDEIYKIFGVERRAVGNLYEEFLKLMHPEDLDTFSKMQELAVTGKGKLDFIHRIITAKGDIRYMHELGQVIHNETGEPVVFAGTVQDVTERILAQNEIIKEKNLSDSVINSLPGIFYLYDRKGKFLRWNKNFEKVTGYNAEEIAHMHPLDFFDIADKDLVAQKITNTFNVGEDSAQTDLLLKTKKKIPYYFTGKAIDYEGHSCVMGVGVDFSERIKNQEKIKETTEQLRRLTAHLQEIREEERKRIGREIHDDLGQQLTAIKMDIAWIDKKIPDETSIIKQKIKNVIGLLDGSNQSIRRILSELRPGILANRGLVEALEWLGRQFNTATGIPVQFSTTETEIKLPEPLTTCIFRVYQEALTNITRYAGAGKVNTSLQIAGDVITVQIADDGIGFDPGSVDGNKSFGILGMKERVLSNGGKTELISSPGNGTNIIIMLPVKRE